MCVQEVFAGDFPPPPVNIHTTALQILDDVGFWCATVCLQQLFMVQCRCSGECLQVQCAMCSFCVHHARIGEVDRVQFWMGPSDNLGHFDHPIHRFVVPRPSWCCATLRPTNAQGSLFKPAPLWANTDLGQTASDQIDMFRPDLLRPDLFWPMPLQANVSAEGGWGPKPRRSGTRRVEPRRVGAQNVAFFSSPATIFFLSSLFLGSCVEFWWCLKRRGVEMCTYGVRPRSRRGFTRQPESQKTRMHLDAPTKILNTPHRHTPHNTRQHNTQKQVWL